MELPDAPKGEIASHGILRRGDSLQFLIRSPKDIIIGFELREHEGTSGSAYVAAFDGKTWKNLSPMPPKEGFWQVLQQPDGGLWLQAGSVSWFRREDNGIFADDWAAVCPATLRTDGRIPDVVFDPQKRPWLFGGDSLVEYSEGRCVGHPLPDSSPTRLGNACHIETLMFLPNSDTVVVRQCDTPSGVESRLLLARATDKTIVR
jgi:hypothetical protein